MSDSTGQTTQTFHWSRTDFAAADAANGVITAYLLRYAAKAAQGLTRDDLSDLSAIATRAAREVYDARDFSGRVTRTVLAEVAAERGRQNARWGEQNHPQADPVILDRLREGGPHGTPAAVAGRLAEEYEVPTAKRAQFICESEKPPTWFGIALEEFSEVLDAIATGDPAKARTEWLQLAAVAVAAAESLDRNEGGAVTAADQSTWPAHLRDDAPSQRCNRCGRFTWSPGEFNATCGMSQPNGQRCDGQFEESRK